MNRAVILGFAVLVAGAVVMDRAPVVSAQADDGWVTLFDNTNLDNFNRIGDANWALSGTDVAASQGNGYLVTKESYSDFELELEFWVSTDANSGIFLRAQDPQEITATNAYEVNIFDTRPDPTYRTGGIVNVASPALEINTGEQWNLYRIRAEGPEFTVMLNGGTTVDGARDEQFASGPIAFQYGAGVVRFRNIRIRPL